MVGQVFMGMVSVLTMPQQPENKAYVKPKHGKVLIGTGQPIKGRKHGGGMRFGEQENGQLTNQGAAYQIREWTLDNSDALRVKRCTKCGRNSIDQRTSSGRANRVWCPMCNKDNQDTDNNIDVTIPGSWKNLCNGIQTAGIVPRVYSNTNVHHDDITRYIHELQKILTRDPEEDIFAATRVSDI
jgi:DNA-directed RNA polymerase beta subunit